MKIRILILVIVCLIATLLSSAYALGSGTKAIGNIVLKNGRHLDSVRFEMPNYMDKQVKVIVEDVKRKYETDSIECIVLWHEKHPDMKYLFKPLYCEIIDIETGENLGMAEYPLWMCCEQVENNASYWYHVGRPDFKKGNIRFNYNALYSYKSTRYVLKKGSEHPCHIPNSTKDIKKWAKVYFSDDPEVVRKLESGEYDFKDWGYKSIDIHKIIADYNPVEKD